jgi:hypothetical protein
MTELAQVIFGKELESATPDTPYSRFIREVLCLDLMGLNLSGLEIAQELDINKDDAREMIQRLRQGIVRASAH